MLILKKSETRSMKSKAAIAISVIQGEMGCCYALEGRTPHTALDTSNFSAKLGTLVFWTKHQIFLHTANDANQCTVALSAVLGCVSLLDFSVKSQNFWGYKISFGGNLRTRRRGNFHHPI